MMTTLTKYMKKTTAIAMAAMVLSLPLASVASAHERHDAPPPRHSDRVLSIVLRKFLQTS